MYKKIKRYTYVDKGKYLSFLCLKETLSPIFLIKDLIKSQFSKLKVNDT